MFKRHVILSQILVIYSNSRVLRRQTSKDSEVVRRNKIRKTAELQATSRIAQNVTPQS